MITFKKNSWHYKFNKWAGEAESGPWINATSCKSICPYFWCTVWNIFWVLVFFLLLFFMASLSGAAILDMSDPSIADLSWLWIVGVCGVACIIGVFILVAVGIYLSLDYTKKGLSKVFSENKASTSGEYKEPNLVIEWVKAKKAKICPMIEFKD